MCIGLFGYASAAYGEACKTDSDCTTGEHTTCQTVHDNCPSKACTGCASGYELNFLGDACVASIGTACGSDTDCLIVSGSNGACTGSVCACASGYTYDSTLKGCTDDTKAKFGESCSAESDCQVPDASDGACTATVCACKDGYVKGTGYTCRAPTYDEACVDTGSGGPACVKVSSDTSDNAPTCQSSKCQCEAANEKKTILGTTVCLTAKTDTLDNGLACTAHNECTSKFCFACPGAATGSICIGPSSNNNASTIRAINHPLLMVVVALIAGVLQM